MSAERIEPLQQRLESLQREVLRGLRRGIEKESLRVRANGGLATTPHPELLGSALTHPHITTDFSESQLELITGVHAGVASCLDELTQLHQYVYREIGDELLWVGYIAAALFAIVAACLIDSRMFRLARRYAELERRVEGPV